MTFRILDFEQYVEYVDHPLAKRWLTAHITNQQMDNICLDLCDGNAYHALVLKRILFWHGITPEKENRPRQPRLRNWRKNKLWLVKQDNDWHDECRVKKNTARNALTYLKEKGLIDKEQGLSELYQDEHGVLRKASFIRLNWEKFFELLEALKIELPEPVEEDQNQNTDEHKEGDDPEVPQDDTSDADIEPELPHDSNLESPPDGTLENSYDGISELPPDGHFPLYTDFSSLYQHVTSTTVHDAADFSKIENTLKSAGVFGENCNLANLNGWTPHEVTALVAAARQNEQLKNPAGFIVSELKNPECRQKYRPVERAPAASQDQEYLNHLKKKYATIE